MLLVSLPQEQHAIPSEGQRDESVPAGERRNVSHLSHRWPTPGGRCGRQARCIVACSKARVQPRNLGAVAVALQLRVCYSENADPGAFLSAFVLQSVYFLLESRSAAPTQIPGHIHSHPAALCKTSTNRNINSYFSGLTPERDKWSIPHLVRAPQHRRN